MLHICNTDVAYPEHSWETIFVNGASVKTSDVVMFKPRDSRNRE